MSEEIDAKTLDALKKGAEHIKQPIGREGIVEALNETLRRVEREWHDANYIKPGVWPKHGETKWSG